MPLTHARPSFDTDASDPSRIRLAGQWTLATALQVAERLREVPAGTKAIDATHISRIDSAGVTQQLQYAGRINAADAGGINGLDAFGNFPQLFRYL